MKAKILVIDDDQMTRDIYAQIITDLGHDYLSAENGKEGVDLLATQTIDLIFLDLLMPVMDGFEVLRWMSKNGHQDVPVIIFTQADAQNNADFKKMAKAFGAFVTHDKPISTQNVKDSIDAALK